MKRMKSRLSSQKFISEKDAGEDSMFYDVYALKKGGQLLFHKNINDNEISSLDSDLIP